MSELPHVKSPEKKDARVIDTRPSTNEPTGPSPQEIAARRIQAVIPSYEPSEADVQNPGETDAQRRLGKLGLTGQAAMQGDDPANDSQDNL